ncbi:MAG TPA: hypothetical protein VJV39_00325, partial [Dongiaceae bacterium]|nr:hypothetical protein [Dongiaceae bacterium]
MQRDNAAHDTRESPLNRLLKKPATEAPAPANTPSAPVASTPQAAPQPAAAKPAVALSPSEIIAN